MAEGLDQALFQENERLKPTTDSRKLLDVGPFWTLLGGSIPNVAIAYETWGELNSERSNAILVCHALSGDSHAIGWWDRVIGPGKALDTNKYFVIGTNSLGGCQGTTGPASLAPDGKPFGTRFPAVTVADMVDVQAKLLDHLEIDQLLLVAGGSMGGMQALELAVRHPNRLKTAWITASCAAHNAMQIGFNEAARQAVMRDPRWMDGMYDPADPPVNGLSVARMIGHISFLSEHSFERKFGRNLQNKASLEHLLDPEFQVESYLNYQGDKFTSRFDANSLLYLTKAIDWYECASLETSKCDFVFTSFSSDTLYPPSQSESLHQMALQAGLRSTLKLVDLPFGHDSFLLDGIEQVEPVIHQLRQFE